MMELLVEDEDALERRTKSTHISCSPEIPHRLLGKNASLGKLEGVLEPSRVYFDPKARLEVKKLA